MIATSAHSAHPLFHDVKSAVLAGDQNTTLLRSGALQPDHIATSHAPPVRPLSIQAAGVYHASVQRLGSEVASLAEVDLSAHRRVQARIRSGT